MEDPSRLRSEALLLAAKAKRLGITQESIAEAIGASQSQVSRVLSGHIQRRSRLFDSICVYVNSRLNGISPDAVRANPDLIGALAEAWDGTAEHAAALSAVIRSLSALRKPRSLC